MSDFAIEITKQKFSGTNRPHCVSVTHNGNQWSMIALYSIDQLRQLRDEIDQYIKAETAKDSKWGRKIPK